MLSVTQVFFHIMFSRLHLKCDMLSCESSASETETLHACAVVASHSSMTLHQMRFVVAKRTCYVFLKSVVVNSSDRFVCCLW